MAKLIADISHYHPVTDWNKAAANNEFLISKATQGTSYIDSTLSSFIRGCESHKIPYYLYTFLNNGNEKSQAEFMVRTCRGKVGSCFRGYILDVERNNSAKNVQAALEYLKTIPGRHMIYTMYAEYSRYKDVIAKRGSNVAWWEARYGRDDGAYHSNAPCHGGVDLHQYTSKGSCPGITGKLDLNRLTGTKSLAWFTNTANQTNANNTPVKQNTAPTTPGDSKIRTAQAAMNRLVNAGLAEDGKSGPATKKAVIKTLQYCLNKDYQAGLAVDGVYGSRTDKALGSHYVRQGEKQYLVTWVEIALMILGYYAGAIETPGSFGSGLAAAVAGYQHDRTLSVDKVAGYGTLRRLVKEFT